MIALAIRVTILVVLLACLFRETKAQEVTNRQCGPRDHVLATLAQNYGETPIVSGIIGTKGQAMMLTLVNPTTGTWTVITVGPDGTTCVGPSGDSFGGPPALTARERCG